MNDPQLTYAPEAPFKGNPIGCMKCGDVIFSRYYGEYRTCKCGAISVDQTPHYSRYMGNMENFNMEPFDNNSSKESI